MTERRRYNVVMLGLTGSGKSHTVNNLTGKEECLVSGRANSVTFLSKAVDCTIRVNGDDVDFRIIDTPGLMDTDRTQAEVAAAITHCIQLAQTGVDLFLFVIKPGRWTEEQNNTCEMAEQLFGTALFQHCRFMLTHHDQEGNDADGTRKPTTEMFLQNPGKFARWLEKTRTSQNSNPREQVFLVNNNAHEAVKLSLRSSVALVIKTYGDAGIYTNEMFAKAKSDYAKFNEEQRLQHEKHLKESSQLAGRETPDDLQRFIKRSEEQMSALTEVVRGMMASAAAMRHVAKPCGGRCIVM